MRRRIPTALSLLALGGLLVSPARASHAYVLACCTVPSSVSIIDRASRSVAGTFFAGQGAVALVFSPDGKTAYVANESDATISVLDAATGVQTATISLSSYSVRPYGLVISPDGSHLYVTAGQFNGAVDVVGIGTGTNTVLFDVQTSAYYVQGYSPIPAPQPVISSDGQTVYILASELLVFNTSTLAFQVIASLSNIPHPQGLALTPDGAYAALTFNDGGFFTSRNGQFALVDLHAQTVVTQIGFRASETVGPVVISPDGSLAYFPSNWPGKVAVRVFDIAGRTVVNTFGAGTGNGVAIAITPDGSELELGEASAAVLSMNAATGAVTANVATFGSLVSMTVSANGWRIYVPNFDSSTVEVIDPTTSQISGEIPAGWVTSPTGFYDKNYTMVGSADGRRLAVAAGLNFTFIDTVKQQPVGVVPFTGTFVSVSLSPHGERAYAVMKPTSGGPPQIRAIDTEELKMTGVLNLTPADQPSQDAVSPDGSTLYVSEQYCPSGGSCVPRLLEINAATLKVTGTVPLNISAFTPGQIAIAQDGKTAYVEGLYSSGGVSVVDLTQGQVVTTIPAQYGGSAIALAHDQQFLYEIAPTNYFYYVINLAAQQATPVPDNVGVPWEYPSAIAVSPDGRLLYLASELLGYMVAYSTHPDGTAVFLGTVNLPSAAAAVVFSPI